MGKRKVFFIFIYIYRYKVRKRFGRVYIKFMKVVVLSREGIGVIRIGVVIGF